MLSKVIRMLSFLSTFVKPLERRVMKIKIVWIVFFVTIGSLFMLQVVWLFNSFQMKKADVENIICSITAKSIEDEMLHRMDISELTRGIQIIDAKDAPSDSIYQDHEVYEIEEQDILEAGIHQTILQASGYLFNIVSLDSIFQENLKDAKLPVNYLLAYKDSTGTILDQIGNLPSSKVDKAFHTDALLIVDGKRVQAIVDISPSVIIQRMIWLLVASFLILLLLVFCVVYQAKTMFTQYKLNQLREDFTHALVHDMKTPLSLIGSTIISLKDNLFERYPKKKEEFAGMALKHVGGLNVLVDRILTVATLGEDKTLLRFAKADVPEMLEELKSQFSNVGKRVTIQTSCELDGVVTCLDPVLIREAVANLLDNAVKYSGESVLIQLDCYTINDQLYIRVRDNGFGISSEDQQIVFNKFERGAAVRRKKARGFGLGLSYVKQVTEAHGGIVALFSEEGKGSEFTMILPLLSHLPVD